MSVSEVAKLMNAEHAAMIRPGYRRGDWIVTHVSYEIDYNDMGITHVWTHEMLKKPRSTEWRHRRWNPLDKVV